MKSLIGKVCLVTGSTSGIGLGIAHKLANEGANIILNGRGGKPNDEKDLCNTFQDKYKIKATFEAADMSNPNDIEIMINRINNYSKGIDILVNNAGIQHVSPIKSFPIEQWNTIISINLNSVFHTSRLVLPYMETKNWGRIINIASVHGLVGSINKAAYVSAKHGVLGFTKVTALEYAHTNITMNAICPGIIIIIIIIINII
jgi:3-hydroxybutyrate dehydrogenase